MKITFNKPYFTGRETVYIKQAHERSMLAGDGYFTKRCHSWLEDSLGIHKALLTHSCTAALEMMAILADVGQGDEVIMPSYTFVSTANAFVLRGATPVFIDIRPDTLNMDENLIDAAITSRTKAIVPVHYAGVGCEMDRIMDIAAKNDILVLEDAAQGMLASYKGRNLGAIGHMGAYSFHETKNIISGEGGALLVNDPVYGERAEIIREKGTNRSQFFRGEVDKYTWQDIGSSYLPGELTAAFLMAQLEYADEITKQRKKIWERYHENLAGIESAGVIKRPGVPSHCEHNGHMYYIQVENSDTRESLLAFLAKRDIKAVFHYVPLHSSPGGRRYGRCGSSLEKTDDISPRLVRLPLYYDLDEEKQDYVINALWQFFGLRK